MYPQYHPYLLAAAIPANTVSPQSMRYLGYGILISAAIMLLRQIAKLFDGS